MLLVHTCRILEIKLAQKAFNVNKDNALFRKETYVPVYQAFF